MTGLLEEVNAEKTNHEFLSRRRNAGQSRNVKTCNKILKYVTKISVHV